MDQVVAKTKKEERARQLKEARKKQFEDELEKDKIRAEADEQCVPHTKSRIFRGLKILGHVSNHVPCVLRYVHRRRENFIITCIGKSINTYASNQLSMLSQSGSLKSEISCMAGDTYHVYVGSGNVIYAFRRGIEITHEYNTGHNSSIQFILPFGEHLLSVDETGCLCMRDIKTEELTSTIQLDPSSFKVTAMMHPATYINKVLLASHQGTLQLWNVKKMKMVHMFPNWAGSSILTVVQAPAIDCVALALSRKRIVIHNLRYDKTIMTLTSEDQPLTIGFRTDNVETMVTGNSSGSITLWDLNNQEVIQHVVQSHAEPVTGLQCLHQEPLFFTSSPDNSVKLWIFDGPGGTFRELCTRSGHSQPPGRIRFFANSGFEVLTAGRDGRLRQFHLHNATINRAWGENKIPNDVCRRRSERASPIVDFTAASIAQMTHHDDIALLTEDEAAITTWSSHTFKQNSSVLFPSKKRVPHPNFIATCVFLTSCGQFVVVGYNNGAVHRYNIQSGLHRMEYSRSAGKKAHEGTVRGVAVDAYNTCVASGGADNILKLWKFGASETYEELTFISGIASMFRHRQANLLGVILDSFDIIVVCLSSKAILRELNNISSPLQDALFSPDSRWLTASSADCLVRTWDLPTSNMIDIFRLESIVTYMDYSPDGQILATALNDNVGILLWSNKTLFKFVSLLPIPLDYEPPMLEVNSKEELPSSRNAKLQFTGYNYASPEFLDNGLVTFSKVSESKWKTLTHLDIIRERNKPKQPAKKHVAPFFLPSELKLSSGSDPFGNNQEAGQPKGLQDSDLTSSTQSKILSLNFRLSPFASALLEDSKSSDYHHQLCQMLESMSPFQIEAEILGLGPEAGGSLDLLEAFMGFVGDVFQSKRHFDTGHAVLNFFLKTHVDILGSEKRFQEPRKKLRQYLVESSESFLNLVYEINGFSDLILGTAY